LILFIEAFQIVLDVTNKNSIWEKQSDCSAISITGIGKYISLNTHIELSSNNSFITQEEAQQLSSKVKEVQNQIETKIS
jgi:hypothetical protein